MDALAGAVAAFRGGPFHSERRKIAELPPGTLATEPEVIETLERYGVGKMPLSLPGPGPFPTLLRLDVEIRHMPGYDVMPGGHFLYWLRGHQGRIGLYVCEEPGMTPADMHRRLRGSRVDDRAATALGLSLVSQFDDPPHQIHRRYYVNGSGAEITINDVTVQAGDTLTLDLSITGT